MYYGASGAARELKLCGKPVVILRPKLICNLNTLEPA